MPPPPRQQKLMNQSFGFDRSWSSSSQPRAPPPPFGFDRTSSSQPRAPQPRPDYRQSSSSSSTVSSSSSSAALSLTQNKRPAPSSVKSEKSNSLMLAPPVTNVKKARVEEAEPITMSTTHAILCIDQSGSMRARDVEPKVKGGHRTTRHDAVFACAIDYISGQAQTGGDPVVFSLVLFADTGRTVFSRLGPAAALAALKTAQRKNSPSGGTCFAAAFDKVRAVARGSKGGVHLSFLTDGKPGDLCWPPPGDGKTIPTSYRSHGKTYASAAVHLERLRDDHGDRLEMHYVAIHEEGHAWLRKLVACHGGHFHDAELSLKEKPEDQEDDDFVEIVAVHSAEEAQRKRQSAAAAAGQVITLNSTTVRSGTISSTFSLLSSTLTTMRGGKASQVERQVTLEASNGAPSVQNTFAATRMVLNATQDKFQVPPGESPNERRVQLSQNPFAQGGIRNVFSMTEQRGRGLGLCDKQLVAKESRHEVSYAERLSFHKETSICQTRAAELARSFNRKVRNCGVKGAEMWSIEFLRTDVYRLVDSDAPGGFRYLAVEPRLEGNYEKYNSNNGFVLKGTGAKFEIPQAFSHFTFEETSGKEMVVDIQGSSTKSSYRYTDPQLHSRDCQYGRADRGTKGFTDFFASHTCNGICRALKLPSR